MVVPLLVLALVALLALALASHPTTQAMAQRGYRWWRRRTKPAPAAPRVSSLPNGDTIVEHPQPDPIPEEKQRSRLLSVSSRRFLVVALVVALLLGLAVLPRSLFAPSDQFLVLVAPFSNPDGAVNEAGRAAARDLVQELNRTGTAAVATDSMPGTTRQAEERMRQQGADALVYGTIADGALLDQPSLSPMMVYLPSGAYAPNGWDGYRGRFAMPRVYSLSSQPLNGKIVLPLLMRALGRYGAGDSDGAFADLEILLNDYPEADPSLPRALRGNMLWALGNYPAAIAEYERTGALIAPSGQPSELALLANNLGAIYQDQAGPLSPEATRAFNQAAALLGGENLPELRVNLARQQVAGGKYDEAIAAIGPEQGPTTSTNALLTLVDAYLGQGRFDDAERLLDDAPRQAREEVDTTIEPFIDLATRRLLVSIDERKNRLALDRAVGNNDQILWELLSAQPIDRDILNAPRDQQEALINRSADLARDWQRVAAAADVAQQPYRAQIANNQARLAEKTRYNQRKLLAAIDLKLDRGRGAGEQAVDSVFSLLRGQRAAESRLSKELRELAAAEPNDAEANVLLGFGLLSENKRDEARSTFERVNGFATSSPEPVFGLARTYLPDDRERAKSLLREAIARDDRFFPARTELAQLAQQDNDWATTIEQRRWLAEQRNTIQDKLVLADTLQRSGPSGYAEAEQVLLPLANDKNVDAAIQLSDLYAAAGDQVAAEAALQRARAEAPRNAQVAYKLGVLLNQLGRQNEAREQFKQAVALDGDDAKAHVGLGEIYSAEGDIQNAARQYDAALRSGTDDPAALQDIGRVLLVAGQYNRALDAYRQAATIEPNNPEPQLGIAQVYLAQKKPSEAAAAAEKATKLPNGNTAPANVTLGNISLALGDPPGAIGHFTVASQLDPRYAPAQLGLGRTAALTGQWDVARGYFDQAIGIDQNLAEARLWKGEALLHAGNLPAATVEYSRALEIQRNYPEASYGMAKAQAASGDLNSAHAWVKRAVEQRQNYADAYVLDGLIYEQENKRNDARRSYDRAIEADRTAAEPYYRRALLTIADGDLPSARGDLEAAIRNRDNFPEAHYWLGRSFLADGKPDRANQQFSLALSLANNNYPEALYYQGVAREQLGDLPNAYAAYQGALQQSQGSAWAAEAQAALNRLGQ